MAEGTHPQLPCFAEPPQPWPWLSWLPDGSLRPLQGDMECHGCRKVAVQGLPYVCCVEKGSEETGILRGQGISGSSGHWLYLQGTGGRVLCVRSMWWLWRGAMGSEGHPSKHSFKAQAYSRYRQRQLHQANPVPLRQIMRAQFLFKTPHRKYIPLNEALFFPKTATAFSIIPWEKVAVNI